MVVASSPDRKPMVAESRLSVRGDRAFPPVKSSDGASAAPLSLAQSKWRDWSLTAPDISKIVLILRLRGRLNVGLLEAAIAKVVERHHILRTAYGVDLQEVHPLTFQLPVTDLSAVAEDKQEIILYSSLKDRFDSEFSLAQPQMLDLRLFKLNSHDHYLGGFVHHIAFDEVSAGSFWNEIFSFYRSGVLGFGVKAPPLPLQYVDFARWERSWLNKEQLIRSECYWTDRLDGVEAVDLTDGYSLRDQPSGIGSELISIEGQDWQDASEFCRRNALTIVMLVLTALGACLSNLADRPRIALTYLIRGRPVGFERTVGCFAQARPYCVDLFGDPTFLELLDRSRCAYRDASDLRLAAPHAMLAEREINRVAVNIVNWPAVSKPSPAASAMPGLSHQFGGLSKLINDKMRHDLQISMNARPGAIGGVVNYAVDRCPAAMAEWLAQQTPRFLTQAVRQPNKRCSELLAAIADIPPRTPRSGPIEARPGRVG